MALVDAYMCLVSAAGESQSDVPDLSASWQQWLSVRSRFVRQLAAVVKCPRTLTHYKDLTDVMQHPGHIYHHSNIPSKQINVLETL